MPLVNSMAGLGDNIYQLAFVDQLERPIYINTPWPQLYSEISDIHFVRPDTKLRTQKKNVDRLQNWDQPPRGLPVLHISYAGEGIPQGMSRRFGKPFGAFKVPSFPWRPTEKPYVLIRPATVRSEWRADARNPDPAYLFSACEAAKQRGYLTVLVADLEEGKEWAVGGLPKADINYLHGELSVAELLGATEGATALIGGIGWLVPAALAMQKKAWVVCGGQGGFNAPELIAPPNDVITFAVPNNLCRCRLRDHSCDKRISNYDSKLATWADQHLPVV